MRRVNEREISNSKDIRKLRKVLKDPVAEDAFLNKSESIDSSLKHIQGLKKTASKKQGLAGDVQAICESIRKQPWTELAKMKGDKKLIEQINEAKELLKQLKKSIAK